MESALAAGPQDEYGDFDLTTAAWDAADITLGTEFGTENWPGWNF